MTAPSSDTDISTGLLIKVNTTAGSDETGKRFDQVVTSLVSSELASSRPDHPTGCSREIASQMIRQGRITLNNAIKKPGTRLQPGDHIEGTVAIPSDPASREIIPEPVKLDIIHSDSSIIVINKPAGLVVHPAPGHWSGTLVHGLQYYFPETVNAGPADRPGIVHRIDKDTSGIMLVARTPEAYSHLTALFKARQVEKTYLAFVYGNPREPGGHISSSISRHKKHRKKMAVSQDPAIGREALTTWQVVEHFKGIALLRLGIKTGRTHQIRVHCAAIGHPLVGDSVYGYKNPLRQFSFPPQLHHYLKALDRQMLHSQKIAFAHPETGLPAEFESPLPLDMRLLHNLAVEHARIPAD